MADKNDKQGVDTFICNTNPNVHILRLTARFKRDYFSLSTQI